MKAPRGRKRPEASRRDSFATSEIWVLEVPGGPRPHLRYRFRALEPFLWVLGLEIGARTQKRNLEPRGKKLRHPILHEPSPSPAWMGPSPTPRPQTIRLPPRSAARSDPSPPPIPRPATPDDPTPAPLLRRGRIPLPFRSCLAVRTGSGLRRPSAAPGGPRPRPLTPDPPYFG